MSRQHRRIGIGAGITALAAMAVAGCSSSSGGSGGSGLPGANTGALGNGSAISLVADAMNQATKAGTVKIDATMQMSGTTPETMHMTGQEQYSPQLAMSVTTDLSGQSISEVLIGTTVYMKMPQLSSMTNGKPWAKIDLSKASATSSLSSLLTSAKSNNPTTQLSALLASGAVTEVGKETVDGQQATHYHGTLDASQVLALGSKDAHLTADQISTLKSEFQTSKLTSETVDLWVGSGNLPVEIKVVAKMDADGMTGMTMDMHMSDWGAPANIGAPPAGQVYDLTSELNAATGQN